MWKYFQSWCNIIFPEVGNNYVICSTPDAKIQYDPTFPVCYSESNKMTLQGKTKTPYKLCLGSSGLEPQTEGQEIYHWHNRLWTTKNKK